MSSNRLPVSLLPVLVLAAVLMEAGCAARPGPSPPADRPSHVPVEALRIELDRILHAPLHDHAHWAVVVQSLQNGEVLYSLNSAKLMMPASNMKILTLAAAAARLGWNYRFETRLITNARVETGVLQGDVVVIGEGDPTIGGRDGPAVRMFESWADQLAAAGIRAIDGRLIGDDDAFEDDGLGAGWAWDYLAWGYAAPSSALPFNEATALLTVQPPSSMDGPIAVDVTPAGSDLLVVNRLQAVSTGDAPAVALHRLPGSNRLEVSGTVPVGIPPFSRTISVDNPTQFFVNALKATLAARGIDVRGTAADIDDLEADDPARAVAADSGHRVLVVHRSPPLSEIGTTLMKVSQNLYADMLLRTLGQGSTERGRAAMRDALARWGVAPSETIIYDGSGLSRYNYVTADALIKVLRHFWRDPAHAGPFVATFPVAGRDGTMSQRLRGTRAEGNARAKTGSIANVRSLSGYVDTLDGEPLAFAILANHFSVPQATIDDSIDMAVERLASFTRRQPGS